MLPSGDKTLAVIFSLMRDAYEKRQNAVFDGDIEKLIQKKTNRRKREKEGSFEHESKHTSLRLFDFQEPLLSQVL